MSVEEIAEKLEIVENGPFPGYIAAVKKLEAYIGKTIYFQEQLYVVTFKGAKLQLAGIETSKNPLFNKKCFPHAIWLSNGNAINLANLVYIASSNVTHYDVLQENDTLHPDILFMNPKFVESFKQEPYRRNMKFPQGKVIS